MGRPLGGRLLGDSAGRGEEIQLIVGTSLLPSVELLP